MPQARATAPENQGRRWLLFPKEQGPRYFATIVHFDH